MKKVLEAGDGGVADEFEVAAGHSHDVKASEAVAAPAEVPVEDVFPFGLLGDAHERHGPGISGHRVAAVKGDVAHEFGGKRIGRPGRAGRGESEAAQGAVEGSFEEHAAVE